MLVPLFWLADYIDWGEDPHRLASLLTARGLEVEGILWRGEGMEGVRIARLAERKKLGYALFAWRALLPEGEHSVVTRDGTLQEGDLVPLAPAGTVLPNGRVESLSLGGVTSEGILLSGEEMGLGPHREGVLVLPEDAPLGESVAAYLDLPNAVLEISLTPSFAVHCQSLLGLGRELAAATGRSLREPERPDFGVGGFPVPITVEEPGLCPRYAAGLLTEARNVPSPFWLLRRLIAAGVRSHGVLVDVTNFVMLEYGQPLHAFDLDRLDGGRVVVRRASDAERIVTLDGQTRELTQGDLLIAGEKEPAALAGIMGALSTEVREDTRRVLLEAALFHPAAVRRTSRRLGLLSEAAARFEKGVDPDGVLPALGRALGLLSSLGAGVAHGQVADLYPSPRKPVTIPFRPERARELLGAELPTDEMLRYLEALGLRVSGTGPYTVEIPPRRSDLQGEADLVEEVARSHGYDRLPATLPRGRLSRGEMGESERRYRALRELLIGAGFNEAVTSSFLGPEDLELFPLAEGRTIRVQNPLGEDRSVLRPYLLPGLLRVLAHNLSRGVTDGALFEVGTVHRLLGDIPEERSHLALLAVGRREPATWGRGGDFDFFDIKGVMELLLERTGRRFSFLPSSLPSLHPYRQAAVRLGDREIGFLGEAHPHLVAAFELGKRPLLAEVDLSGTSWREIVAVRQPPRYPAVVRDLAMVLSKAVAADSVREEILRAGGENLEEVSLFDVYEGPPVPEGERSLAYRLTYRSPERTLTETEVEEAQERVREALRRLGAVLRS